MSVPSPSCQSRSNLIIVHNLGTAGGEEVRRKVQNILIFNLFWPSTYGYLVGKLVGRCHGSGSKNEEVQLDKKSLLAERKAEMFKTYK